ncbi:hypothetical protein Tco_1210889 [Tanacetum coccineum]
MIMDPFTKKVLWDFWNKNNDHEGVADEEFSDVKEANNDDEQETAEIFRIETNLFDYETPTKTYEDYENELNDELEETWYTKFVIIFANLSVSKMGKLNGPLAIQMKTDFVMEESYQEWFELKSFGNFHELDYELLVKLQDYWWNVNDHECSLFSDWRNHIQGPYANYYINFLDKEEHEKNDKHGLFDDQKRPVCNIRRFEMIKYSFDEDEEYVAIKQHEYDDLTSTDEDACRMYQEIFCRMDEGWMVTRAE